eukprot:279972-Rhodomonas_salina.1
MAAMCGRWHAQRAWLPAVFLLLMVEPSLHAALPTESPARNPDKKAHSRPRSPPPSDPDDVFTASTRATEVVLRPLPRVCPSFAETQVRVVMGIRESCVPCHELQRFVYEGGTVRGRVERMRMDLVHPAPLTSCIERRRHQRSLKRSQQSTGSRALQIWPLGAPS